MKKLFRRRNIVLLVIAILIAWSVFSVINQANAPKQVSVTSAQLQDLSVTVSAGGKIQPTQSASLRFPSTGRITSLTAKEGDYVTKGQTLGYLSGSDLQAQETKAQADLLYQTQLIQQFNEDTKDQPRNENYFARKNQLDAQLAAANAALAQTRSAYSNRTLIAPIDGTITKIYKFTGDVTTGDVVMDIQNDSEHEFVAEVDENDIGIINPGAQVLINLDAYPLDELPAQIISIEQIARTGTSGNTYFPVKIQLQSTTQTLRSGMNGDALIVTDGKSSVLTIPLELIDQDDNDQTFVYLVRDGQVSQQFVTLGLQNDTHSEIVSGLSQADQLITSDTTNLKVGDRVVIAP